MLAEIISELTKAEENASVASEPLLEWAKRVEAQKTQSAFIYNLSEM